MGKPTGLRPRPVIPVLWPEECRSIPTAIATAAGIQKAAMREGFSVRQYETCQDLLSREPGCSAVIVVGFEAGIGPGLLAELRQARKEAVVTGADTEHLDGRYSCVTFSRRMVTEQLLEHLQNKRCRRVAMVGCIKGSASDQVYMDAMKNYIASQSGMCGECFYDHRHMGESFEAFARVRQEFDAVLCPNAPVAVSFLRFCQQRGYQVPQELLVASLKDSELNRYCCPSLTSIAVDFTAIGEQAVVVWRYLQDAGNSGFRMRIAVHGQIVVRESTGAQLSNIPAEPNTSLSDGEATEDSVQAEDEASLALTRLDRCLQRCDELDLRIIGQLIDGESYERICEKLFLSESSLQYRVRKLFRAAGTRSRREYVHLLKEHFTLEHHFSDQTKDPNAV